jgi:unsaturated rhamnogalacturonyl hydrolase
MSCKTFAVGIALAIFVISAMGSTDPQVTTNMQNPKVEDSPSDPGPFAKDLSPDMRSLDIQAALRKVADWQTSRMNGAPSQDWTFATLYIGLLAASATLETPFAIHR